MGQPPFKSCSLESCIWLINRLILCDGAERKGAWCHTQEVSTLLRRAAYARTQGRRSAGAQVRRDAGSDQQHLTNQFIGCLITHSLLLSLDDK